MASTSKERFSNGQCVESAIRRNGNSSKLDASHGRYVEVRFSTRHMPIPEPTISTRPKPEGTHSNFQWPRDPDEVQLQARQPLKRRVPGCPSFSLLIQANFVEFFPSYGHWWFLKKKFFAQPQLLQAHHLGRHDVHGEPSPEIHEKETCGSIRS